MEPVVSLFVVVFVAVLDFGAGGYTAYIDDDWKPQKPTIKNLASLVNDKSENRGKNRSAVDQFSAQPPNESIIKYLLVAPSPVIRDERQVTEKNDSEPQLRSLFRNNSGPEEAPTERRFKSSSHLRLQKTDDDRIVIRDSDSGELKKINLSGGSAGSLTKFHSRRAFSTEKSRATRNIAGLSQTLEDDLHGKRQLKRGRRHRIERFLYDSNLKTERLFGANNRDSQLYRYYPEKLNEEVGDRFYYNDFGSDEQIPQSEEVVRSMPQTPMRGNQQNGPRRFQADSCRKYLEFLKYAFEQLDAPSKRLYSEDQDEYFYYDDDYNKAEPKMMAKSQVMQPPPVITPDMAILHKMAVTNYGRMPDEVEPPPVSGTERRSTDEPGKSSTSVSPKSSSPLSFDVLGIKSETEGKTESTPENRKGNKTESSKLRGNVGSSTPSALNQTMKDDKAISEDCHEKLFPCPDNINVTYPVNGYCNRFVACEAGKPHPEFCQDGLHFNLVERQCDLPHNSFCTYSCPTADGYFAVPGDCGGFFRCSNWYPEYRLCPPRMHWDNKAKICTFQELSSCSMKCDEPYQVKPYSGVCNAYIICTRSIPRYHQCPDGSHFDGKQLKCISKLLSNCTNDEDYIARNRGMENGKKTLCADIELKEGGKARWCQETFEEPKT